MGQSTSESVSPIEPTIESANPALRVDSTTAFDKTISIFHLALDNKLNLIKRQKVKFYKSIQS